VNIEDSEVSGFKMKLFSLDDMAIGVATDIGPRILYVASRRRPRFNLFGVLPDAGIAMADGFWRIYGGHRLWSSPEAKPRSYSMDDKPVRIVVEEDRIMVNGNPEIQNSTQKKITIEPLSDAGVRVIHDIKNIGRWPIELGCWALTVMRKNGFAVMPLKPAKVDEEGLLPDRHISLWPYTDPSDVRLTFANGYVFVKQDPQIPKPVKIGAMANPAWTAYWVDGTVFVKEFSMEEGEYPDFGCSVEVYTNAAMLELETVGPMRRLQPSESVQHTEIWRILEVEELTPEPESVEQKLGTTLNK